MITSQQMHAGKVPWLALFLTLPAALFFIWPESQQFLQFERPLFATGQFYRILTGHWMHWTQEHVVWDAAVFLVLGAACERISRRQFLTCIGLAALTISVAVALFLPQLGTYRGLSGIDSALYGLLLMQFLQKLLQQKHKQGIAVVFLLIIGFLLKITFETWTNQTLFVQDASSLMTPVPLAHLVGFVTGVSVAFSGQVAFPLRKLIRNNFRYPNL